MQEVLLTVIEEMRALGPNKNIFWIVLLHLTEQYFVFLNYKED